MTGPEPNGSKATHTLSNPASPLRKIRLFLGRPVAGPFVIGLIFGGVPFGISLCYYVGLTDKWGDPFFGHLTPVAVLVAALGTILSVSGRPARLLWRAFLTSLGACIPVPIVTWTALAWRSGFEILDIRNLPFIATILVLWALAVTVCGWLLALAIMFLKNRHIDISHAHERTVDPSAPPK